MRTLRRRGPAPVSVDSEGLRAGDKGQNLLGKSDNDAARQGQEAVGTLGGVVALEGEAHLDDAPAQQDQAHGPDQAEDERGQVVDDGERVATLGGKGRETFAQAAWENGIDPRWSPAISNTESTKGRVCFKSHNAWGWDQSSWSNWDTAIRAHVAGLARGYGFTISYAYAQRYCPPNYDNWYRDTLNQMQLI